MTQVLRGQIILPDRVLDHGTLVLENGLIVEVEEHTTRYRVTEDLGDAFIAPGYIDIHTHGIAGADTMQADTGSLSVMAARYAAHGVTSFLPTTMSQAMESTLAAIRAVRGFMSEQATMRGPQARVLGVHLEGPWLAHDYRGAQHGAHLIPPDVATAKLLLAEGHGTIAIVSLAPELQGADEVMQLLRAHGVIMSIAHTGASAEDARRAIEHGATHVTHCFNGMPPLHHRHPGVIGAALLHDELYTELIADGIHVHPDVMRILVRMKGKERVVLVTDSMSATDLGDGTYDLGGQEVVVRNGEARLHSGALAGSTLTLDSAVRNMITLCGISIQDAVFSASAAPADALGIGNHKGRIGVGYDADLTILDNGLYPRRIVLSAP